jgi:hypothetical protein
MARVHVEGRVVKRIGQPQNALPHGFYDRYSRTLLIRLRLLANSRPFAS